jgi:hypothetical protein
MDDELCSFKEFCVPKNAEIARILSNVLRRPANDVFTLRGVRSDGVGTLALRRVPNAVEVLSYFDSGPTRERGSEPLSDGELVQVRKFEHELDYLCMSKEIRPLIAALPGFGVSRERTIRPIAELHRDTVQVSRVALLATDVIAHLHKRLNTVFAPRTDPSGDAVVRALLDDPGRLRALIPRLAALREAIRRERRTDRPVLDIPCIPYQDRLIRPGAAALRGNHGDFWGDWKVTLPTRGLSAEEQELYRFSGVLSGQPDSETSLQFFRWLSAQPDTIIAQHEAVVIRHLAHTASVRTWWEREPALPCVLIDLGQQVRLASFSLLTAMNSPVYLPDFPELAATIRNGVPNDRVLLVVESHRDVAEPITDLYRMANIRSLRTAASDPLRVVAENAQTAPESISAILNRLLSPEMINLRKRLNDLDVPIQYLREHWRTRVEHISGVKVAAKLEATFRVGRRDYIVSGLASTWDAQSGTVWLSSGSEREMRDALFGAIALRIFNGAPKFMAGVLENALQRDFSERSAIAALELNRESALWDGLTSGEPAEVFRTHRTAVVDPKLNLPNPGTIPQAVAAPPAVSIGRGSHVARNTSTRSRDELESAQQIELKQNHYAWHCQICLARTSPGTLAPVGSYAEFSEARRWLIEAHHVDQVHGLGARHAGNLIILCRHHHNDVGDELTRVAIVAALRQSHGRKAIAFSTRAGEVTCVAGVDVSVVIAATNRTISIFFTIEHRNVWLAGASVDGIL